MKAVIEIIIKEKINFIFPLLSIENQLFSENKKLLIELGCEILISNAKTSIICNNKINFLNFLNKNNYTYPKTYLGEDNISKFPLFIKPIYGSSSKNTYKIDSLFDLRYYKSKYPESIIQEYVTDTEFTIDCLSDKNSKLVAAVIRERILIKDGKCVIGKTFKNKKIKEEIDRLLGDLKVIGPSNVQLFFNKKNNGIKFIEINPRLAAGGLPLSNGAGVNIPELMIRLSEEEELPYQDYKENTLMLRYLTELFVNNND